MKVNRTKTKSCVCVCVCVCACVRACVRACLRACLRARACVRACVNFYYYYYESAHRGEHFNTTKMICREPTNSRRRQKRGEVSSENIDLYY